MNNNNGIFWILIAVAVILVLWFIRRHFKRLVVPNVYLVSGAVKTGKTLLSVHLAKKEYKSNLRSWYVRYFFNRLIGRSVDDIPLKPMLYSNIPLARVKYNLLTMDIIMQKVRIPDKSVVLIDEASLLADSTLIKDKNVNNRLMRFVKLFAHYTHGGKLIIDTQSIADLHFSFKRCMNSYLYIYERKKMPFITIMKVREMLYSTDGSLVNNASEDIELSMRKVIIFNRTYKDYDCYCYSSFTDYLPYQVKYDVKKLHKEDDLKAYHLVTFQSFGVEINKLMEEKYK